jgi:hypothetical protein
MTAMAAECVEPAGAGLTDVARAATGRPDAEVARWSVEPVAYPIGSWATAELSRVRGVATSGAEAVPWSVFVKVLRSPHGLRLPAELPAASRERLQAMVATDRTWRHEADVYRADLDDVLAAGMRMPARYRIDEYRAHEHPNDEHVGDRIVEWLEDVPTTDVRWDHARFARAAGLLGRLAVRLTRCGRLPDSLLRVPGEVLRLQFLERELFMLPALAGDAVWSHPLVAAVADRNLQADLLRLAERVPALLDTLDGLPQTFVHGDASPQNLLVPAGDPDTFVAVDWSLMGPAAVGYDLGQLLVGLAHMGRLDVAALPALQETVLPAYTAGLADEGLRVDADVVRFGVDAALVVRSAFSALPLRRLAGPPSRDDAALVAHRARLARHLVDLGLALPTVGP